MRLAESGPKRLSNNLLGRARPENQHTESVVDSIEALSGDTTVGYLCMSLGPDTNATMIIVSYVETE